MIAFSNRVLFIALMCTASFFACAKTDIEVTPLGNNLFSGEFAKHSFSGFNPNHTLGVGDVVRIRIWGGTSFEGDVTVDEQGHIFIPKVGPIKLIGTRNSALNETVSKQVERIFQKNVYVYAALSSAQPIKIYVSGHVSKPGLYAGLSSDSVLHYLDQAGGIDPIKGSYIDVSVRRQNREITQIDLYQFINAGILNAKQLHDGDVIFVGERHSAVVIKGLVSSPSSIEFREESIPLNQALSIIQPLANATHARIQKQRAGITTMDYVELADSGSSDIHLKNGDAVSVVSDQQVKSISVRVEGEHLGNREVILNHGATLD